MEDYGYIVTNVGKYNSDSNNYQDFNSYPLKLGLPKLNSDNAALHYAISIHGQQFILIKENNISIHVHTNMYTKEPMLKAGANGPQWGPLPIKFIPPFFIEKTKAYKNSDHTCYVFTMLYQKIAAVNKYYDKGWGVHPYKQLETYYQKYFKFLEWGVRTEIEAGR